MVANRCSMMLPRPRTPGDYRVGVTTDSPSTDTTDTATSADAPRYRCAACGNITRFDVVTVRRTKAFHHYSVGGDLALEEEVVLDETVEEVSCRWCGHGNAIEILEAGAPIPE
jgi:DNA-directed RNA polymerase subunit RPC12/RpoP